MSLDSTKQLQTYDPQNAPADDSPGQNLYLSKELQRISLVLNQLTAAAKALDARLKAGSL